jgi:hypothetical protein
MPCSLIYTDISEVLTASFIKALKTEAVNISKTLCNIYQTIQHNIPKDSQPSSYSLPQEPEISPTNDMLISMLFKLKLQPEVKIT